MPFEIRVISHNWDVKISILISIWESSRITCDYTVNIMSGNVLSMKRGKRKKNRGPKSLKIFPDSSWLISLIHKNDSHHTHVKSSFGFLSPQKPIFFISTIVLMETISGLIKNGMTVKKAVDKVTEFVSKLDNYRAQKPIELDTVVKKYKIFAKTRKIKQLTTMDFYIVTEGMLIGAKILTSDVRMYKTTKPSYKDIYLISDKVKGMKSDLPRLTENIIFNLRA